MSWRTLIGAMCGLGVLLAAAQTALLWNTLPSPDAIAYFEIADQIRRVGYAAALPLHWSPLYPLYLAAVRAVAPHGLERELLVTAAADGVLLVALCGAAALLLARVARLFSGADRAAVAWTMYAAGVVLLFAFAVLRVGLRMPDALVAALALVVLWIWIGAIARGLTPVQAASAGLGSGLAFLARANLLHWSVAVAIAAIVLARPSRRLAAASAAAFAAALLLVVAPQVAALSAERGRMTIGESGKTVFAETYGATWSAGVPAWPVRAAGGDVRIFADSRALNFPGFYDPSREYEDATVRFEAVHAVRGIGRSILSLLFGYWTSSFALAWPLLWTVWPIALFAPSPRWRWRELFDTDETRTRARVGLLLIAAGAAGVAMHLLSFAIGYYMPAYLIPLLSGAWLLVVSARDDRPRRAETRRAAGIVAAGCVAMTVLSTAQHARASDRRGREAGIEEARALVAALAPYPAAADGLRRVAAAGPWLGEYGLRLARASVVADVPDRSVLDDGRRRAAIVAALRERGVVALLVADGAGGHACGTTIAGTPWRIVDLRPGAGGAGS